MVVISGNTLTYLCSVTKQSMMYVILTSGNVVYRLTSYLTNAGPATTKQLVVCMISARSQCHSWWPPPNKLLKLVLLFYFFISL